MFSLLLAAEVMLIEIRGCADRLQKDWCVTITSCPLALVPSWSAGKCCKGDIGFLRRAQLCANCNVHLEPY